MSSFSCGHCGASLDIPDEDRALDVRCSFCGKSTPLPRHILELRRRPDVAPSPAPNVTTPLLIGGALVSVSLGVGIFLAAAPRAAETPTPSTKAARSGDVLPASPPPTVSAAPAKAVPRATGEAEVSQRMQELYGEGCKDVILAPSQTSGDQTVDTKFILNGRCVTVLAMSGDDANELRLTMRTPLGAALETPPKASRVEFAYCPKMAGAHPTKIVPSTDAPYTVAAIECPKPAKKSVK